MNNAEITMLENKFTLPMENDFFSDDLAEDYDGLQLTFPRVKIPGGGNLQFELPSDDPENPDYAKTITGVILYNHQAGAYWPEGAEYDDNVTPLCSSVDGKQGYGMPGGSCALCELNRYGTGVDAKGNPSKGKACKNMRHLYILQDGEYMPTLLSLPPTSLRPFNDFMNAAFVYRRRATYSAVVQIGLKRVDNGNNPYSVATFKKLFDFTGQDLQDIKIFSDSFRSQIKLTLQQQAYISEERAEPEGMFKDDTHYTDTGSGEHFCIQSSDIDGARDELPA